jgi:hypothetical protein
VGGAKATARQEQRRSPSTVLASNLAGERLLNVEGADRIEVDREPAREMNNQPQRLPCESAANRRCVVSLPKRVDID